MNNIMSRSRDLLGTRFGNALKLRNDLKFERIEYLRDTAHKNLIVLIESDMGLTQDVNISVHGNKLTVEAIQDLSYDRPYRTHLIQKELLDEFENGGLEIGFSEVMLDSGYNYDLLTYQVIGPGLLKVILSYSRILKQKPFYN